VVVDSVVVGVVVVVVGVVVVVVVCVVSVVVEVVGVVVVAGLNVLGTGPTGAVLELEPPKIR